MAFDMLLLDKEGWIFKILLAIFFIILGVLVGKIVSFLLKKISDKMQVEKKIRPSIIVLFLFIIRWSIYLLFINFAVRVLEVSVLTEILSKILLILPTLTGGIILIVLGFGIALLLKNVITDINIPEKGNLLAEVSFYFVWYIFGLYALRTALNSLDAVIRNYITLIWTAVLSFGIILYYTKQEKQHSPHSK